MLHVIINNTRYNLADETDPDTAINELVRTAQQAMQHAGVDSTSILNDDTEETGFTSIETGDTLESEYPEQAWALTAALGCSILSNIGYDGRGYGPDVWTSDDEPGEYWVLAESEREDAISNYLDSILKETVLREIPAGYQDYFDRDRWKEDQIKEIEAGEGYGGSLASYDGNEREACIDGEWYYVYRVN